MVVMYRDIICHDEFEQRRQEHQAAIIIQAQIRKFLAIKMVDRLRYERENENMKYQQAAICLQKHVRRFLATRYVERIKTRQSLSPIDHEKRRYSEETAAIIIQCQIRKFLASRRVSKIRAHREAIQQIRERHAAVVIQRFYRTHRNRQFELAAIKLQSHIRKFLALRRYKKMKSSMKKNDQTVEIDQSEAMKRLHDNQIDLSDDHLNEECDRLISKTEKVAKAVDSVGPMDKSAKKYNDYTAAVTIQRSWRGYNTRRRHSDILEKLAKTRLSLTNAPSILENPREHRQMTIRERIDIYMPLFYCTNSKKRQLAASFMNRITIDSQKFVKEFIERDGIQAIISCSSNLGRDYADTLLQKELVELLSKCLDCPTSENAINSHSEEILKLLVSNVNRYRKNVPIMKASCNSILKLSSRSDAPGILKKLQLPFYVSQWRRQLGANSKSELLSSLQKAEQSLRLINALPE